MIVAGAAQRFDGQHRIGIVRAAFALACILGDHPPFGLNLPVWKDRPRSVGLFAGLFSTPLIMLNPSVISDG